MDISLIGTGKKYYREWIFRNVNFKFVQGSKTVILGPNGSGKSTLLQVIAGAVLPNEGRILFSEHAREVSPDDIFKYVSFASPYLELIEEFTLKEIIDFHFKFKSPVSGLSKGEVMELTGLNAKAGLVYKFFSSGMKQRIKLALAVLSDTPLLFLDEPCSNLDSAGVKWYRDMIKDYSNNRILIVASNQNKEEFDFCESEILMSAIK